MRPDEHKKKKNAQYKKKHGMAENESKPDTKSKGPPHQKGEKSSKTSKESEKVLDKEVAKSKVKVKDVSEEDSKQFSRRQIVSNWSRYEDSSASEGEEDDLPLQRGEDFNKLLAQAGGSASLFRFKDEAEWAEDTQDGQAPSIMALDFENLASSLSCIPLHERLGISESVFSQEQLDVIRDSAIDAQSKYQAMGGDTSALVKTVDKVQHPVNSSKTENKFPNFNTDGIQSSDSSAIEQPKVSDTHVIHSQRVDRTSKGADKENHIKVDSDVGKTKQLKEVTKVKSKEVENLEDDLDMILSLDDDIDKKMGTVSDVKDESIKPIEKKATKADKEPLKNTKDTDKLEDWLDTLLDG